MLENATNLYHNGTVTARSGSLVGKHLPQSVHYLYVKDRFISYQLWVVKITSIHLHSQHDQHRGRGIYG